MQGNEKNRPDIDDQFVDEAWQAMQSMLDRELPLGTTPERKRRRRLLLLWLTFAIGMIGLSLGAWYLRAPSTTLPPVGTEEAIAATPSIPTEATHSATATPAPQTKTTPHSSPSPDTDPQSARLSDQLIPPQSATAAASPNTSRPSRSTRPRRARALGSRPDRLTHAAAPASDEASSAHSAAHSPSASPASSDPKDLAGDRPPAEPSPLQREAKLLSESPEETTTATTLLTSIDPLPEAIRNLSTPFQPAVPIAKWQWKIAVSTLFEKETPAFRNWGAGVVVRRRLTRRLALQGGLSWHHLERSANLGPQGRVSATNFVGEEYAAGTTEQTDLRGFNEASAINLSDYIFRNASMPNLDYLVLPLATSLKVTDKLSINTGLSTAVLLTGLFTNHSNEDAITVDDLSQSPAAAAAVSDPELLARTQSFVLDRSRRFDLAAQIGVNLQVNQKWGVHLDYHHGFRDITINEQLGFSQGHYNRYFRLGLNYNLSNHRGL
ncbi:MAG: outer membrane beta-barrel protein [Bacteroidota bacterium]